MDRREFLTAAAAATVLPSPHLGTRAQSASRQFIELRRKKLSADPQYKDNASAISDIILQPTAYSQL